MELQDFTNADAWAEYKRECVAKDEKIERLQLQYERAQKDADQILKWMLFGTKVYILLYVATLILTLSR